MAATLLGLSGVASRAQTEEEVSALLAEALRLPGWETILTAATGAGYKDNVFLTPTDPRAAPFVSVVGELLWLRLAPSGPRLNFFGNIEARHFLGLDISYQEYTAFSHALLEHDFNPTLTGSLAAQYFYQDQVLDVSVSETNRSPVPVLGHTLGLRPGLRVNLAGRRWFTLESPLTRQFYAAPLDDYREAGIKFTTGQDYGRDSQVTLTYEPVWRKYDNDPARTASGEAIPDSLRTWFQQNARVAWRQHWDEQKHWRSVLTFSGRLNEENGEGYSDYTRWSFGGRVTYRANGWELSAEGRFARYNYRNQTVSATNPALRIRTEWSTVLELERRLTEKVVVVAAYEHETNGSNDPLETYTVNTVGASLRWEF